MQVIYAGEKAPDSFKKSIFLIGPTPRSPEVQSWRPMMLERLKAIDYDGVVFVPEPRDGKWRLDYADQIDWEQNCLNMSDVVVAWIPRTYNMLGLTTNVEWGMFVNSGKLLYGRPEAAMHTRYLDYIYKQLPFSDSMELAKAAVQRMGEGAERTGGERCVPLHIWNTKQFQNWFFRQKAVGNRLDDARLLWNFIIPKVNMVFCYTLWVKVWVESEQRHKENEFIFSRTDISCICAYYKPTGYLMDTQILLVREFRSPCRSEDGFVHELPGGSSFKEDGSAKELAAHELEEETGIAVSPERIKWVNCRQMNATLSTHKAALFAVELTEQEMEHAKMNTEIHGVVEDSERTYVEVKFLGEIIEKSLVDWSMLGMIMEAVK